MAQGFVQGRVACDDCVGMGRGKQRLFAGGREGWSRVCLGASAGDQRRSASGSPQERGSAPV